MMPRLANRHSAEEKPVPLGELWHHVHAVAQQRLTALETELRRRLSGYPFEAVSGRTQGANFFLFTYRTFWLHNDLHEPVTVGITFRPAGNDVTIEADASGERTGEIIFSAASVTVRQNEKELIACAERIGRELEGGVEDAAQALIESSS